MHEECFWEAIFRLSTELICLLCSICKFTFYYDLVYFILLSLIAETLMMCFNIIFSLYDAGLSQCFSILLIVLFYIVGLAIYDTMQYIRSPISTICIGQAASMGSLLLAAGAKGERRSLPNARVMIHQPSGGYSGQAKDITIHTKEIVRIWDALNALYVKHTGQPIDLIQKNMDRDYFMTPEEAKEFGIIDEVVDERPLALVTDAVRTEGKDKTST